MRAADDIAADPALVRALVARHGAVVFGAGSTGAFVVARLHRADVAPRVVIDNDARRAGSRVHGVAVMRAIDAVAGHADAVVIVAVSTVAYGVLVDGLRAQGWRRIVCLGAAMRAWPVAFLPHFHADGGVAVAHDAALIARAEALWHDDASRACFRAQIAWRRTLDARSLGPLAEGAAYFPDLVRRHALEHLVNVGAFTGDTLREFLALSDGRFQRIDAIEADPANADALDAWRATLPCAERIAVHRVAAHAHAGTLRFAAGAGEESHVVAGDGDTPCAPLDALIAGDPTWITIDVEGAEPEVLDGATRLLASARAVWAVSVYHRPDHLWTLPLHLAATLRDYRFALRAHHGFGYDVVAYAIPAERWA